MTNNIKVTVSYEKPTTSRIDTLFAEYDAAHNLAEATKAELTPIIDAVGEAKHRAILDQLEPIKEAVKKLHKLRKQTYGEGNVSSTYINTYYTLNNDDRAFVIKYSEWVGGGMTIVFSNTNLSSMNGFDFEKIECKYEHMYFSAKNGIIANWNKLNIIEGLQKALERQIQDLIQVANRKRDTLQANFNAIMND
mgnify:CR=1 FL=1